MAFATINGARLWYTQLGSADPGAPAILLHHGYTASRVNWLPAASRMTAHYRVILMECRGTGESEHTADGYTLAQYAADVIGMALHIGLTRFTFAGHSMGGGVGYLLGLDHPERLDKLVLMAAVPADGFPAPDPEYRARRIALRRDRQRDILLAEYRAGSVRPDVEDDAWLHSRIDHIFGVSDGHYIDGAESMRSLNVGNRLHQLSTPTLVLAGAADGLLQANLADYARLPNAALHVLSRAGHDVALHEPAAVAEAIDMFMRFGPARPAATTPQS